MKIEAHIELEIGDNYNSEDFNKEDIIIAIESALADSIDYIDFPVASHTIDVFAED